MIKIAVLFFLLSGIVTKLFPPPTQSPPLRGEWQVGPATLERSVLEVERRAQERRSRWAERTQPSLFWWGFLFVCLRQR